MAEAEVGLRLTLRDRQKVARGLQDTSKDADQVAESVESIGPAGDEAASGLAKATDRKWARGFVAIGHGAKGLAGFIGRGLVTAAKAGAVGLAGLAIASSALSVKAVTLSSDAAEVGSAFDTVFGPSAGRVQKQLDKLTDRFGIYNPELQDAARGFGVFAKAAGVPKKNMAQFSTSLTKAGLDLGSFYNAEPGEVFDALKAGLAGEMDGLKRFGILISDASMKAKGASLGFDPKALTEQQKVLIRQKLILEGLGDARGDLARTEAGFANQERAASGRTKELLKTLGGPMKTALTGALKGFNAVAKVGIAELTKRLPGLNGGAESLSQKFERWGNLLAKRLPGAIDTVLGKWDSFKSKLDQLKGNGASVSLGSIGDAFGEIGASLSGVDWGQVGSTLDQTAADGISVFGVAIGFAADHIDTLAKYLPLLLAGFVAYKAAQAAANVVALLSVPIRVMEILAIRAHTKALTSNTAAAGTALATEKVGMLTRIRSTAATVAGTVAEKVATGAKKAGAAAQWLLNAAMTANPIGLVIAAIALLVGGFILLYKKSDTFRNLINGLWQKVLVPLGKFLVQVFLRYITLVGKAWLGMGRFGVMAFRLLLTAAFRTFDGILAAAEAGLGWIPGLGPKIKGARRNFNEFADATIGKLKGVEGALGDLSGKLDNLTKPREITVTVSGGEALNALLLQGVGVAAPKPATPKPSQNNPFTAAYGVDGARAKGGPVRANHDYLVGEEGMEIFRPSVNGTIVPNHQLPSNGGIDLDADILADPDSALSVGPAWPGGPMVIQLMVDRKVLTEVVLDGADDKVARL